jgi:hypothetical protein
MKPSVLLFPLLLILASQAQAKIYMYVDADGRKGATDRREAIPPGAKITSVIDLGDGAPAPGKSSGGGKSAVKTPSPANFPRIDSQTQRKRDDVRRAILEEELASERKNLEEARHRLAMGEKPLAGENTGSPGYQARVKPLRAALQNHERNIAAIQKELGTAR